jgi:hypothetical protein
MILQHQIDANESCSCCVPARSNIPLVRIFGTFFIEEENRSSIGNDLCMYACE